MFGYGVGGEYPMAAGSAAERAEARGRASAKKRGREVVLTFSMQARSFQKLLLCLHNAALCTHCSLHKHK